MNPLLKKLVQLTWVTVLATGPAACTTTSSHLPDGSLPELVVDSVQPATLLPGTRLQVNGRGFVAADEGTLLVEVVSGNTSKLFVPERLDSELLEVVIDRTSFDLLGGPGRFTGRLEVEAEYSSGDRQRAGLDVDWQLVESLTPELKSFTPLLSAGPVYLGSQVEAYGSGFLLGRRDEDGLPGGEGVTELRLAGTFTPASQSSRPWQSAFSLAPADPGRTLLAGSLPAECLGIEPGVFAGSLTVVNVLPAGTEVVGNSLVVDSLELGPTFLDRLEPLAASRGQRVVMTGRGFVSGTATTVVSIEGTFTETGGTVVDLSGDNALLLVPTVVSGDTMEYVLRVAPDGQGGVTGLGARPGLLAGTATPVVYWGAQSLPGIAYPGELQFTVQPQKQVVYLKYLPGFTDALRRFGLRNVEQQIHARIMEVVRRDYWEQGINVVFQETRPVDFVEYGVVEIGGDDPNGRDLLGLDATMTEQGAKDMGNIYFDDVVGGWNAESAEQGHLAYGGVFLSSFMGFSPKAENPMPIADPLFDEVFEQFMPERGGRPVQAGEYPGGPRAQAIERAIHALGSMIGTTVTHEWGHTMGLAYGWGPAEVFHNIEPGPNQIMDAGRYRPFAERAELDGQGPATWTSENLDYLREILPRP
ncbi:MAG: hypothetical protein DRI34_13275 [Deltaproteobacteria bacterium]|nr:MAG: hypothetical protein DRI34_13275 [Deltaproteobacteria bacterium]